MEFSNAMEDKDIQLLERERFEDIMTLQNIGEYDAAEQINKVYDFLKKELETKKQILAFDDESDIREAEMLKKREKIIPLLEKEKKLKEEQWTLQGWKDDLDAGLSNKEIDKNQSQINARLKQIDRELEQVEKDANTLADDLDEAWVKASTREVQRATLVDKLFLEGDKALYEVEKDMLEKGNLLGLSFDDEIMEKFNETRLDSYNQLQMIEHNTAGIVSLEEKLDALLQLKQ